MTENQNDGALPPVGPESNEAAQAPAAPAAPAESAAPATPAAPAAPVAPAAAPTAPAAPPAPAAPAAAPAAPAQPTATVYTPGQAPQPYHAAQYTHPTQPTEPIRPAAASTQPTAPVSGGQVPPAFGGPQTPPPAGPEPRKRRTGLTVAAVAVAAALIGGASGAGITALIAQNRIPAAIESAAGTQNIVVNDTDSVNQITAVAAKASPSVVTISVSSAEAGGTGSGVILSEDGYVLTNTHVVTLDGATADPTIEVKTSDGQLYDAELIGTDPLSDLAVIKLVDASGMRPLDFADSDELNVGDTAIAIGAPMGLSGTVTNGIVSALNRSIDVQSSAAPTTPDDGEQGDGQEPYDFWNFDIPDEDGQQQQAPAQSAGTISIPVIQTDAAINPGNSGGALLDSEGKLIGINVAILSSGGAGNSGNIGVGFAVPANLAERVSKELIENGSATHGLLGATVTSAQSDDDATQVGALITEVTPGGAAEQAGLQAGDVVTAFNGVPITSQTDLTAQVRAQAGGSEAEVTYVRDGKTETVAVTLGTFEA